LFFPYCLLVKTPLPLLVLLALAGGATLSRWSEEDPTRRTRLWQLGQSLYETAPLWALLTVYWASAVTSHLNIGQRHILPVYPPMYILAGGAAYWLQRVACFRGPGQSLASPPDPRWAAKAGHPSGGETSRFPLVGKLARPGWGMVTAAALVVYVAEAIWTWPNYLAYFNVVVGGPRNGYKHLVDSSLDWGQDLPGLKKWLERNGLERQSRTSVYLAYFGTAKPDHYGIDAIPVYRFHVFLPYRQPVPLKGGVYCVSATTLQGIAVKIPGPWTVQNERMYQNVSGFLKEYEPIRNDEPARKAMLGSIGFSEEGDLFDLYEHLRLARLCAYLRRREPDDMVNYSILIYRLSDAEVEQALHASFR
jgi:hypothetical protein